MTSPPLKNKEPKISWESVERTDIGIKIYLWESIDADHNITTKAI